MNNSVSQARHPCEPPEGVVAWGRTAAPPPLHACDTGLSCPPEHGLIYHPGLRGAGGQQQQQAGMRKCVCVSGVQQQITCTCVLQKAVTMEASLRLRLVHTSDWSNTPTGEHPPPPPPQKSLTLFVAPMTSTLLPRAPSMPSHSCMNSVLACVCFGGGEVSVFGVEAGARG